MLLILPGVQSIACTPWQIKGVWKSETQTSFSKSCFFIFWAWCYFTFPRHTCKHQSEKALQEQRFQRRRVKAVGWWVPQCAGGRGALFSFSAGGWETRVKSCQEDVTLRSKQSDEQQKGSIWVRLAQCKGKVKQVFLIYFTVLSWSKEDYAVKCCSTAGLWSVLDGGTWIWALQHLRKAHNLLSPLIFEGNKGCLQSKCLLEIKYN